MGSGSCVLNFSTLPFAAIFLATCFSRTCEISIYVPFRLSLSMLRSVLVFLDKNVCWTRLDHEHLFLFYPFVQFGLHDVW
jgi:hypothetical protein